MSYRVIQLTCQIHQSFISEICIMNGAIKSIQTRLEYSMAVWSISAICQCLLDIVNSVRG